MNNAIQLGLVLTLKDAFSQVASKIESNYNKMGVGITDTNQTILKSMNQIKEGAIMMGVGMGLLKAVSGPLEMAKNFETAMARISTVVDTNVVDMKKVEKNIGGLSMLYTGDQLAQADALYSTMITGITDVDEATELLHVANKMATGGVTDVETAIEGLTKVMGAYNLGVDEATKISDDFFGAQKLGRTNIDELAYSIGDVAGLASTMKVSYTDTLGTMSALSTTLGTKKGTVGFRQLLESVLSQSKRTKEASDELGISWDLQTLQSKGLMGMIQQLGPVMEGNEHIVRRLIPGIQGTNAAMLLAGEGADKYEEIMGSMGDTIGETEEAFEKIRNTLEYQLDLAKSTTDVLKTNLGKALMPVTKTLVTLYTKLVRIVVFISDKFPILGKVLMGTIAGLGGFLIVMGAIRASMGLYGLLLPAMTLVTKKFGLSFLGMAKGMGLGLVKLAPLVILLYGAVKLLQRAWNEDWGGMATSLTDTWNRVKLVKKGFDELRETVDGTKGEMSFETANALMEEGLLDTTIKLFQYWGRIQEFSKGFAKGVKEAFDEISEHMEYIAETFNFENNPLEKLMEWFGADAIGDESEKYNTMGQNVGKMGTKLLAIIGIMKLVSLVIGIPLGILTKVFGPNSILRKGIVGIVGLIGEVGIAILGAVGIATTLPAWAVGLIILAIVGVAMLVWKFREEIYEIISGILTMIGTTIAIVLLSIVTVIGIVIGGVAIAIMSLVGVAFVTGYAIVQFIWGILQTILRIPEVLWETVKLMLGIALDIMQGILLSGLAILKAIFTLDFEGLGETLKEIWGETWEKIQERIGSWQERILEIWDDVKQVWDDVMDGIHETADTVFGWIGEKVEWFTSKIDTLRETIGNMKESFGQGWDRVKDGATGIKDRTVKGVSGAWNKGKDLLGFSSGGHINKGAEGQAYLHENEVVVNSPLVEQMKKFFSRPTEESGTRINSNKLIDQFSRYMRTPITKTEGPIEFKPVDNTELKVVTQRNALRQGVEELGDKTHPRKEQILTEHNTILSKEKETEIIKQNQEVEGTNKILEALTYLAKVLEDTSKIVPILQGEVTLDGKKLGEVIDKRETSKRIRRYDTGRGK